MQRADLIHVFSRRFGRRGEVWVQAPGRVNILGEHTDYNEGFVLPCAIDRYISIIAAGRCDRVIRAYSVDFDQTVEFPLERIERCEEFPWSNYLRGVLVQLLERSFEFPGADLIVRGDIPIGAGLSSSAAFEVAVAETFRFLYGLQIEKVEMALLCQAAENRFVGVQCGIMDQFVSTLAERNHALFLDCRDLSYESLPLHSETSIVVCDSSIQRSLDHTEYGRRRLQCEEAVRLLTAKFKGIRALRDVRPDFLAEAGRLLPQVLFKRLRHVVAENTRVQRGVRALENRDLCSFGELLYQSHESLKEDFEVSCKELDLLVDLAREAPGAVGARMTGAGFGGCTVNLVSSAAVRRFCEDVKTRYLEATGLESQLYVCRPSAGVCSHRLPPSEIG